MATEKQIPKLLGVLVEHMSGFLNLSNDDCQWAITNPKEAIALFVAAIQRRMKNSFTDLLSACKQVWVNDNFNENNFPLEPAAPDESEYEVYEHHFDKTVKGMDVFKKLEDIGYRLCGPRRAMGYIANGHLNDQLAHPLIITARGQGSTDYWYAYAPVFEIFDGNYGGCCLVLVSLDRDFDPFYGWLVLRKKQSV